MVSEWRQECPLHCETIVSGMVDHINLKSVLFYYETTSHTNPFLKFEIRLTNNMGEFCRNILMQVEGIQGLTVSY